MDRTFVIGDIHGDLAALEALLAKLSPKLDAGDTTVFIGDYVDRGPDSRQVIDRVERFRGEAPGKTVLLRGNHEDAWIENWTTPSPGFLLPPGNGCVEMLRSFADTTGLSDADVTIKLLDPKSWLPAATVEWMRALPAWYEDQHALYVHAGLDGKRTGWLHPSKSREEALLWTRDPDFWITYRGKRVVFGHTPTKVLPNDHLSWLQQIFDDEKDVWTRGDLVGVDTACGKGGFLSAVELPSGQVIESR